MVESHKIRKKRAYTSFFLNHKDDLMKRTAEAVSRTKKDKPLTPTRVRAFQKRIYAYYDTHGRDLPWRKTRDPYRIIVSEIMLQQTQVDRVIDKYQVFISTYPDFPALAKGRLKKLLSVWQGLGYNRRALAFRKLAIRIMDDYSGKLPSDPDILIGLPGIGKYTVGAVMAFAFNKPVVFMDTNIRRVFIHEFFQDRRNIHDEEIFPFVERTLDVRNPRKWFNALMDYGAMLKKEQGNPNKRSAHYTRQSPFENSNRQVRGRILKVLLNEPPLSASQIVIKTGMDAERVKKNLDQMEKEGFIKKKKRTYLI
jgi:A/G-specific adenine glycosylase